MKIAFYAPMKSPLHPVPSGDRLMARMMMSALNASGHEVELVSELRSYAAEPDEAAYALIEAAARSEIARLRGEWRDGAAPDLWLTYHPYYKSPDYLGPPLAAGAGIPYVTAESSYSGRRNIGVWAATQATVLAGIRAAAVNICLTDRDRNGILAAAPDAAVARLAPFIDAQPFSGATRGRAVSPHRILTVAMMRPGDKLASYRSLAEALSLIPPDLDWSISIVGDGPMRAEVHALFAGLDPARIVWHGEVAPETVAALMSDSAIYAWPGHGEAYGLAYLEAQAAGLPVVAFDVAGVPEAVTRDRTALLSAAGDAGALARNIETLLRDGALRSRMGAAAAAFVASDRTLAAAARRLNDIIAPLGGISHD